MFPTPFLETHSKALFEYTPVIHKFMLALKKSGVSNKHMEFEIAYNSNGRYPHCKTKAYLKVVKKDATPDMYDLLRLYFADR